MSELPDKWSWWSGAWTSNNAPNMTIPGIPGITIVLTDWKALAFNETAGVVSNVVQFSTTDGAYNSWLDILVTAASSIYSVGENDVKRCGGPGAGMTLALGAGGVNVFQLLSARGYLL